MLICRYGARAAFLSVFAATICLCLSPVGKAQSKPDCTGLPDAGRLKSVVQDVVRGGAAKNGGMGNQEWAVVVNREGIACGVIYSGTTATQEWPGSRMIAGEKASTANALSNSDYALSTANVYAAAQPGGSLYSLVNTSVPNPMAAFGDPGTYGTPKDPMVGLAPGGVVVFGGGLALYQSDGKLIGGLGLSGDTSCTDHIIAWKVRHALGLDVVPMGPSPDHNDNMILDFKDNYSPSGFGHPVCKGGTDPTNIIEGLSKKYPSGPHQH